MLQRHNTRPSPLEPTASVPHRATLSAYVAAISARTMTTNTNPGKTRPYPGAAKIADGLAYRTHCAARFNNGGEHSEASRRENT